jgi:AcrR family transcriptional regulator
VSSVLWTGGRVNQGRNVVRFPSKCLQKAPMMLLGFSGVMKADNTKLLLMRAGETLFLERGFENVSLRDVAAAAGQSNPSAVSYHFGDLSGFVNAILHRHSDPIQAGWLAVLAHSDAQKQPLDLLGLVTLLVRPIVAKLDDADGGPAYLDLCASLSVSKSVPLLSTSVANAEGATELGRRIMLQARKVDPSLLMLNMIRTASVLYASIASYRQLSAQGIGVDREAFVSDLILSLYHQFV